MKGWEVRKLGEICEIYQPKTISAKDMVPDGPFPVFGANGIIGRYDKFNHEEPQLLVTCRGATCGSVNISLPKSWVTGNAMVVRPKVSSLSVRYLEYFFRGICDFSRVITGAAQPQITRQSFAPVEIAFPSLDEQRRIVAVLDEAFAGLAVMRANAEANLANARALFDSHLNAIFSQKGEGWVESTLGDLCTTQYGISGSMNTDGKGYKIFRMGEVQRGKLIDTGTMKRINLPQDDFEPYRLKTGDVLFNRTNSIDLVGKTGIFDSEGDYCFASYLIRVNFDLAKIDTRFACHLMNSAAFLYKIRQKAAKSVNQANINATILRNETMPLHVDVKVQAKIADQLDELEAEATRLESLYRQKLAAIDELKQSLLQKAFAGELTSGDIAA